MMFGELNEQLKSQQVGYPGDARARPADPIFELHPAQILGFMEAVWELWRRLDEDSLTTAPGGDKTPPLPSSGRPKVLSDTTVRARVVALGTVDRKGAAATKGDPSIAISDPVLALLRSRDAGFGPVPHPALDVVQATTAVLTKMLALGPRGFIAAPWKHLKYAYLIENTRARDIQAKLIQWALTDEAFGTLSDESFRWLRLTEDLFFRDGISSLVSSITSRLRPDDCATRRNAYQRMFGIDLNHGQADGGAYPYVKAQTANNDFVRTLQDLLRELWRGFINARNDSGPRTTDDSNIRELLRKLKTMMISRRLSGSGGRANLSREEFVAVATMEWFELTVATNTAIVVDLKALGDEREDRLRNLGERVKLPAHGKSRSFFQLADRLPVFLREIEDGDWDEPRPVEELYDPDVTGNVATRTTEIINHWTIATGVDLKDLVQTARSA
jgi:hypothetical protein